MTRARELSDRFEEHHLERPASAPAWLKEQQRTLAEAGADRVAQFTLGVCVAVVALVAGLAAAFWMDAKAPFPPEGGNGWALSAFVLVAVLVLLVCLADLIHVRRDLSERLGETPLGKTARAEAELSAALARPLTSTRRRDALQRAVKLAKEALKISSGLAAEPYSVLGRTYLASLDTLDAPPTALRNAEIGLARSIVIEQDSPHLWAAFAAAAEERGDREQAVGRWTAAMHLMARELDLSPLEALDADRDKRAAASSERAYQWQFRPRTSEVYSLALEEHDVRGPATLLTACVFARIANGSERETKAATIALRQLFDRALASWPSAALALSHGVAAAGRKVPRELRTLGDDYKKKSMDAFLQPFAKLVDVLQDNENTRNQVMRELQESWEQLEERLKQQEQELLERQREADERSLRIERGEATTEDRAWQEELVQHALAMAEGLDSEIQELHESPPPLPADIEADEPNRRHDFEPDEQLQEWQADQQRLDRVRRGRATDEDLEWLKSRLSGAP